MSKLLLEGRRRESGRLLKEYMEWFGPDSVYVGGAAQLPAGGRRTHTGLGEDWLWTWVSPIVASNDVHYHHPDRYRLQHALVAARLNTTMERALTPHPGPIITSTLSPQTKW